ncbi:glycosyltransferase family 4 protein [Thermococcus celer]|uniref:Glycosyl transferase family 1 n=1 Tax=Thermococcus celer Vu 13 = JCM 8558 TaxID=1293037 RepID=A0A218P336_THECE|nr:glycosyltransferase family 4 protein [Thermococcus celer]ASI99335.1 glycosyl transferase family 1 [Thermococcus celer Vu 13 = JCM 8558]
MEFKDKNLLIITNSYPNKDNSHYGGIFVKEQVRYLKDYFNEVYVISPQPWGVHRDLQNYVHDGVRVFFPRFFHLPVKHFRKRLGDNSFKAVLKVINREGLEFDLIHAHFTWPSGYAGAKLKERFGVPLVITAHGYDVYDVPFRGKSWFDKIKFALDSADHIITVSKSNFQVLTEKLDVPIGKLSVISNGFDSKLFRPMDKFEARLKLGIPQDKKVLLNVANLVPVKGQKYLIESMKKIARVEDNVVLYIIGNGPLRKELETQIRRLNLEGTVRIVGARPHSEIPLWMNAANLFVLPSLSEGNPTVMFEALGVGLPFVGTAVGGVPEIITSEDYGLLCPPKDPECLAEKILIALEKDWDREKIRKYAERFTWDSIVKKVLGVYSEVLDQR